jgi:Flp pilus assembly protein TadG
MYSSRQKPTSQSTPGDKRRRSGMVVVMFSILLVALIGMLGLVIDTGFMLATHRQAQNAADAAALAAAVERIYRGESRDSRSQIRHRARRCGLG